LYRVSSGKPLWEEPKGEGSGSRREQNLLTLSLSESLSLSKKMLEHPNVSSWDQVPPEVLNPRAESMCCSLVSDSDSDCDSVGGTRGDPAAFQTKRRSYNAYRQLGAGTDQELNAPITVYDVTGAVSVSCSDSSCCGALTDGSVRCWGSILPGTRGDFGCQ
jgi:hypothetical protein